VSNIALSREKPAQATLGNGKRKDKAMELYKKYRPKTFERIIGNTKVVQSLQNMLARGTLPHTILFHGPTGCGKTTLARILRTELQCNDMDFKEINSSNFRGIDTIRDISANMHLAPTGNCRIWLLDEVHMLSKDAQNASLKILEDTPDHVYFFLCTTDPNKLIAAVRNRCTEMPVQKLSHAELTKLAKRVCKKEKIKITEDVFEDVLDFSGGSARLLLVQLDLLRNVAQKDQQSALSNRIAEDQEAIELCRALMKRASWKHVAGILKNLKGDPEQIRYCVLGYAKSVLLNSPKPDPQAFFIIQSFENAFYDSKEAGLVAACYEIIFGAE